ncbi:MAG: phosphoenolpyruvate--protein phosphotransferase [Treponema sp.]|nr:phosphoenolpyruvate--protein phosphotransferase [Treponema sp.]
MVGLVLVSHCRDLALATERLARQVSSAVNIPVAAAGGTGDDHGELGTDAMDIMEAVDSVYSDDGVLVLMDLGSAILSAKTALEFLDDKRAVRVRLCSAPLVEGAVAAAVQIATGGSLEVVKQEACSALVPKQLDLDGDIQVDRGGDTEHAGEVATSYLSFRFTSRLKNGLHARPAAMLVNTISPFNAEIRVKNSSRNRGPESARSINKLALLGILLGDEIEIQVAGNDAEEALAALQKLAENNFGEPPATLKIAAISADKPLSLAPGIGMGRLYRENMAVACPKRTVSNTEAEICRFEVAIARVKTELDAHEVHFVQTGREDEAGIFTAQKLILTDGSFIDEVKKTITAEKLDAAYVYQQMMESLAAEYRKLPGSYLPQRAADINDVASSVIAALTGDDRTEAEDTDNIILAAKEIQPSMIVRFENRIRGFLTETGGETSHAAILAKTLGIPAISGYRLDENTANGTLIIIDGKNCSVTVDPDSRTQADFRKKIAVWEGKKKQSFKDSKKDAVTTDGVKVYIRANVGGKRDAKMAAAYSAEGIGLLRSEFLFLSGTAAPDEEMQESMLKEILSLFPNDPVTIRTLDIGGDKTLSWLDQHNEDNPFLGVRGIRLCQKERQLFMSQLRSILRAAVGFEIKIMSPMISTVEEVLFCKEMLEAAHESLEKEGRPHLWPVPFGIMVETPAAVMMADQLSKVADFFSIGSNDLSQYVMAAERGNAALSKLANTYQIAVLRAVSMTATAARKAGISVSVCGEMAGDPALSVALIGMGITELSMNPSAIGPVKRAITDISQKEAEKTALRCVKCSVLDEVMNILAHDAG